MAQMKHLKSGILKSIAVTALCSGCASNMLYYPTRQTYGNPADHGLRYEEVLFESRDGTALCGWFIPATGEAKGTVLHYHGNAQNMTAHFSFVSWLPSAGFNVFTFDYRGYGKSGGSPTRKGVYEDSCAALDYLRSRPDFGTDQILVLGQSLGGANALAAIQGTGIEGVQAVAIDSAFYSYRLIARDKINYIPILNLLRWPLSFVVISNAKSPESTIGKLQSTPVLIVHGTDDEVIPFRHGQLLYEKAQQPKELVSVPRGHHTDALVQRDPLYREYIVRFFEMALETSSDSKHMATINGAP
jgi:fermentation-respiration switch protein FrsA (DUF1100 family)